MYIRSQAQCFKRKLSKMVKHTQIIRRLVQTNRLSVFGHFVGLALKGLKLFFFKLINMALNKACLMILNKEELVRITLDYQGKFNGILDYLKKDISDVKNDLSGL